MTHFFTRWIFMSRYIYCIELFYKYIKQQSQSAMELYKSLQNRFIVNDTMIYNNYIPGVPSVIATQLQPGIQLS